jgi:hypothetical protein
MEAAALYSSDYIFNQIYKKIAITKLDKKYVQTSSSKTK